MTQKKGPVVSRPEGGTQENTCEVEHSMKFVNGKITHPGDWKIGIAYARDPQRTVLVIMLYKICFGVQW